MKLQISVHKTVQRDVDIEENTDVILGSHYVGHSENADGYIGDQGFYGAKHSVEKATGRE